MVERRPSKPTMRVRSPLPALRNSCQGWIGSSMAEQGAHNSWVTGSSPVRSTHLLFSTRKPGALSMAAHFSRSLPPSPPNRSRSPQTSCSTNPAKLQRALGHSPWRTIFLSPHEFCSPQSPMCYNSPATDGPGAQPPLPKRAKEDSTHARSGISSRV